jgi:thiol-disulfide isomerase/thioredoxin
MKKKTVIKFWASWCGPCSMYASTFTKATEKLQSEEIDFIEINTDDDPEGLTKKYGVTTIPTTIILDENHEMVKKKSGSILLKDLIVFIGE